MNLLESTLKQFVANLSADSPVPGGGSVSALAGALGAALCAMVARLTLGKEKYRRAWEEMERLRDSSDSLCSRLMDLVEEDSAAYAKVMAAYRIPKERDREREDAVQSALKEAASVPMETLRITATLRDLVKSALDRGNPNCLTDAGVAAQLIRAAAHGAAYNVRVNLSGIKDPDFCNGLSSETSQLLERLERSVTDLERAVQARLL
jgi:formiminotetrahydrofolate cyclodeaminase